MGLCRSNTVGFQVYIHTDLSAKFVNWLNENNLKMGGSSDGMDWKAIALDADAQLNFRESDTLCALFIGRAKVGYARDSEQQVLYQKSLNQVFSPRFLRTWQV